MGSRKRPFYRLVAADSRFQRDGRFLEILGHYSPMEDPAVFEVDREKVLKWLKKGAQMSETAESLLRKEGIVQAFNLEKNKIKAAPESSNTSLSDTSDVGEVEEKTE
jgi:small subunit ribosomal protein S16